MPRIGSSSHGESRLRMLRIMRRGDRHDPKDLTVSFRFEGDFAAAFRDGRPDGLLPGETLKNLVHRIAREHGSGEIEELGLALCERVLSAHPADHAGAGRDHRAVVGAARRRRQGAGSGVHAPGRPS